MQKVQAVGTVGVLPIALMMGFPVFLYLVVLEKEKRLLEMMKINGLKIQNYWTMQFFFNYVLYLTVVIVFVFFGAYVFKFIYFRTLPYITTI